MGEKSTVTSCGEEPESFSTLCLVGRLKGLIIIFWESREEKKAGRGRNISECLLKEEEEKIIITTGRKEEEIFTDIEELTE